MLDVVDILAAGLFALGGAALILLGLGRMLAPPLQGGRPGRAEAPEGAVFLFEGEDLVDATPAARRLLPGARGAGGDLGRVLALLGRRFGPSLGERLGARPGSLASPAAHGMAGAGRVRLRPLAGPGLLEAEAEEGGALRLALRLGEGPDAGLDRLALEAAEAELALLRGLAEDAPVPIWTLDGAGRLDWANRAYLALSDAALPGEGGEAGAFWPGRPLWDRPPALLEGQPDQRRLALELPGQAEPVWWEVTSVRRGEGSLHFAADATGAVRAEAARRDLVQTLAKTFAQLATGLAVFDRQRRLVMFNPAFAELTGLPAPFLSGRPLVHSVLDRLRDAGLLPEPRHYASWRDQLAALEAQAAREGYRETWALPDGRTWRVTGRPHPGGALALLFEDISDEVGLSRRARAELDILRAALDALEEAVAVFPPDGGPARANAAYAALWGEAGPDGGLRAEAARWEAACASPEGPDAGWIALAAGQGERPGGWTARLRLTDGRAAAARVAPLPGGGTLARFRLLPPEEDAAPAEAPRFRTRRVLPAPPAARPRRAARPRGPAAS